jgi:hypothetical protein
MLIPIALALLHGQAPQTRNAALQRSPQPPAASITLRAQCPRFTFELAQSDPTASHRPPPAMRLNGRALDMPAALRADLSDHSAFYRFGIRCIGRSSIIIHFYKLTPRSGAETRYQFGRLEVERDGRIDYHGMMTETAEGLTFDR